MYTTINQRGERLTCPLLLHPPWGLCSSSQTAHQKAEKEAGGRRKTSHYLPCPHHSIHLTLGRSQSRGRKEAYSGASQPPPSFWGWLRYPGLRRKWPWEGPLRDPWRMGENYPATPILRRTH